MALGRQTWALIRRYWIAQRRTPIRALLKFVVWPGLVLAIWFKIISMMATDPDVRRTFPNQNTEMFIPTLLLLVSVFNFQSHLNFMVTDKSSGMKSLMISVGLKRIPYYLANFICFIGTTLPIALFVAISSVIYNFQDSEATDAFIVIMFLMFTLHMSGVLFVLNSLFRNPSFTGLTYIAAVTENLFHFVVLWLNDKIAMPRLVLVVAAADPYESMRLLAASYVNCKNNGTILMIGGRDQKACEPDWLLFSAIAFWTVFSYLFAIWFDQACPWQTDTAYRGLFFCLKTDACSSISQGDVELPQRSQNSRYFERSVSSRQVGIVIKKVSKEFSGKPVIDNVSFNIYRGETTLLLGHNGAGKTTLMNIILGKLMPNKGHVSVDTVSGTDTERGIGVCPQTSVSDAFLSVRQHLELFSDIKSDLDSDIRAQDIDRTLVDVNLNKKAYSLPSELSGGMKRKLSLGMAFVGKSSILILDEPSSGLDPDSRVFVWNAIRRYRADRTVLLSTQHMEEADYLGDRIAIMSAGRIVCSGSNVFLTKIFGHGYKLRVECLESKRQAIIDLAKRHFTKAEPIDNEHSAKIPNSNERMLDMVLKLKTDKSDDMENNLISLLEEIEKNIQHLGIRSHSLKSASIEDVLLNTASLETEDQHHGSSTKLTISAPRELIATLINPISVRRFDSCGDCLPIFSAFLKKHFNTFARDWLSLIIFRVVLVALIVWQLWSDISDDMNSHVYQPTYVMFAFVWHFAHYPVIERASGFKTMQMTSSANAAYYWISQFIFDMLTIVFITIAICIVTRNMFSLTGIALAASGTVLFGFAGAFNTYVISTFFTDASGAKTSVAVWLVGGHLLTELLFVVIGATFKIFDQIPEWKSIWYSIGIILYPTDALRYIYHGIIVNGYISAEDNPKPKIGDLLNNDKLPPLLTGFGALLGQTIVFAAALCVIEYYSMDPASWPWILWTKVRCLCCLGRSKRNGNGPPPDQDVIEEGRKASLAINHVPHNKYSLVAHNLSKSYEPEVKAVDHLSFTVNRGECFGLLGVNGAGKSTTFSMIVGERAPDSGEIWVNGCYVDREKSTYMQKLGYDPQCNPVMSLTPREALTFMARLRRVCESTIPTLVQAICDILEMGMHADKHCANLSGGTMRKLTLGMSLIGNPELLLLDEPTAGVDPIARRSVWQLLHDLKAHKDISIVITSHAMEECEAICDRISIMARGHLRCIGTFLHLRTKFSQGCTVRIQCNPNESANNFGTKIVSELGTRLQSVVGKHVNLADTNINSATFNITTSDFRRSSLFRLLKDFKHHNPAITYMVNDSSLEDIFINMAQEQRRLEEESN